MPSMPRPRRRYVQKETSRHGKTVWYFRRGSEKRIRLPGAYESPEFIAAYEAAMRGEEPPKRVSAPRTSLRWLVDQYFESGRFMRLSPETQEMRRRVLMGVCKTGGEISYASITTKTIMAGKVRREATPFAAMNYVKIMSQLFTFAVDAGHLAENPALKADKSAPRSDGHHTWTVDEVYAFQAKHVLGTQARLALDILLYTGFRRGDAVLLGKQHIREGVITFRTSKTKAEVTIPLLPALRLSIDATETGDLALLCKSNGQPWVKESFGAWFGEQCIEAGVPGRAHGLRKAGATFAALNGATEMQLMALYGWSTPRQAEVYTRKASRQRLAEQAANALSPHLRYGAGETVKKSSENKG